MVRYLKLVMRGHSNFEGLYCTLTSVKVFGKGMHIVMQNSLKELNKGYSTTASPNGERTTAFQSKRSTSIAEVVELPVEVEQQICSLPVSQIDDFLQWSRADV